jgi:hypothetical protein
MAEILLSEVWWFTRGSEHGAVHLVDEELTLCGRQPPRGYELAWSRWQIEPTCLTCARAALRLEGQGLILLNGSGRRLRMSAELRSRVEKMPLPPQREQRPVKLRAHIRSRLSPLASRQLHPA